MKTYLEFINEEAIGDVLDLEDLAELVSRLQSSTETAKSMKDIMLQHFQKLLKRGGDYAVKKDFEKLTDLKIKPIIRGKYRIIYDYDKTMQYK